MYLHHFYSDFVFSRFFVIFTLTFIPMDISLSIRHRFNVNVPRGKFVEIFSILKGESKWKLWRQFNVEILAWIRLSKSTKFPWGFYVNFSMSFRCRITVTAVLVVCILLFPNISALGTYSKLIWCNFNVIDIITDIGTTISFGIFGTAPIIINKDNFYVLQNNTSKNYNANIYK